MPIRYELNAQFGHLDIIATGAVTMQERMDCISQILQDESLPEAVSVFVNVQSLVNLPSEEDALDKIALLCDLLLGRFQRKIAASSFKPGLTTFDTLVALSLKEPYRAREFKSESAARKWLDE